MALVDEFREKSGGYYPNHDEIADEVGATQVHYDIVDTTRWGQVVEYVYQRGAEYVKVTYEEGSGDSDIDYDADVQQVKPVERVVTDYIAF